MSSSIINHISSQVFDQDCAGYLKHMGYDVRDGDRINAPYRPQSDSEAFLVNGVFWTDFVTGESGNVYQLALKMTNGDKLRAVKSLYAAAGIYFQEHIYGSIDKTLSDREAAEAALVKVMKAFGVNKETAPKEVMDYLASRMVTEKTHRFFAWIPEGKLEEVLSEEEIRLTSLRDREGQLILWYFKNDRPVYYCTRKIAEKAFQKAFTGNGILQHPIWNTDALYREEHVVWAEGMFDCISLIELGYGVAGEITCNLIKSHHRELIKALRWRTSNHPDWTFTICLDNDELTKDGRRPGNEAAEKIALWLYSNAVDVQWVKHDPAEKKIDINDLHRNKLDGQIRAMIDGAKYVSALLQHDEMLCVNNMVRMNAEKDYKGFVRVVEVMADADKTITLKKLIDKTHKYLWHWKDVYTDDIKDMFLFGADVYVIFDKSKFGNQKHYEVFNKGDAVLNLRKFQRNPMQHIVFAELDVPFRRPIWRVAKEIQNKGDTFNLFTPGPMLLQTPVEGATIPVIWARLLDNLAGEREKNWLLNHLAVYVQALNKPFTIPVLVGGQGTGKTLLGRMFGEGIGGFIAVGNAEVEGVFNSYLMNAVVLLDELASNPREANQLKNKLKNLINENQTINGKYETPFAVELNNYLIIASNEQVSHVPLVIEKDDRRYTIITGGENKDLAHEKWFDYAELKEELPNFMLYLLSRPIDVRAAAIPLANETKRRLTETGEDLKVAYVREFMEQKVDGVFEEQTFRLTQISEEVNEAYRLQFRLTSRQLRPILEDLGYPVSERGHQLSVIVHPPGSDVLVDPKNIGAMYSAATTTTTTTTIIDNLGWVTEGEDLF